MFDHITTNALVSRNDILGARLVWLWHLQAKNYKAVKDALLAGRSHTLIKQLGLIIDEHGVIRCQGRLRYADLQYEAIEPALLHKQDEVTQLLIRDIHERLLHAGISHTLSQLRRQFWVPQGRSAVRSVISRCRLCRKYKDAPFALPLMPPLPPERVSKSSPFQFTGVDYFGPISVRLKDETQKMWVCLFTCLAIRAIHLEVVADCSAKEFIQCLIRFMSRRGTPSQIISDNAPQFRTTKTVFDRIWHEVLTDEEVQSFAASKSIIWKFTTELAPWKGGFYERLVGLVKVSFRAAVGRRLLTWAELVTVATEVEAIVNTRPITYAYSDISSGQCLRPIDFITDLPVGVPLTDPTANIRGLGDATKNVIRLWKAKQGRLQALWQFWSAEYLLSLRERFQRVHKGVRSEVTSFPKTNDVVLVKDSDIPRGCWKVGRIVQPIASADNKVRSAEIQLPNKATIKRPISHLYPLEMDNDDNYTLHDDSDDFHGFTESDLEESIATQKAKMKAPVTLISANLNKTIARIMF